MIVKSTWDGKSFNDTEIEEDCIKIHSGSHIYKHKFMTWEAVDIQIDRIQHGSHWVPVVFSYYYYEKKRNDTFYVTITDANRIIEFYEQRNKERDSANKQLSTLTTSKLIDISRNLVILSDDSLLNKRLLIYFYAEYYLGQEVDLVNSYAIMERPERYKGKAKKDAEQRNTVLRNNIHKVESLLSNFVELIQEEILVKPYLARAIAWTLVQASAIKYYAEIWENEYELQLNSTYSEIIEKETMGSMELLAPKLQENTQRKYVKQVILSENIDLDYVKDIFYYFLAKINSIDSSSNLHEEFNTYDSLIKSVTAEINAANIKQLLTTPQKRKITQYTIDDIDLMSGSEFEEFVALLFKKMGYASKVTKNSGDQGIDVIVAKNGTKIGIQVKCYSNSVGNSAIQEAVAGKNYYGCDKVIVVTNNYFTSAAMELASSNNVVLWNRDIIKEKLKELF